MITQFISSAAICTLLAAGLVFGTRPNACAQEVALTSGPAAEEQIEIFEEPLLPADDERVADGDPAPVAEAPSPVQDDAFKAAPFAISHYTVNLGLKVGSYYDDNIFTDPANPEEDVVITLAPKMLIGLGDVLERDESFLILHYQPTAYWFLDHSGEDTVEQDALLEVQKRWQKLTLALKVQYLFLAGSDSELGDRLDRDIYEAAFKAEYRFSEKVIGDSEVLFYHRDFETRLDTTEWISRTFLNYKPVDSLKIGLGFTLARLETTGASKQSYEQILARITYNPSEKIQFRASAGAELRQFPEREDRVDYVFGLESTWTPIANTRVELEGNRRTKSSAILVGQDYVETGVEAGIYQTVFQNVEFGLRCGYKHSDYIPVSGDLGLDRKDDYLFLRAAVLLKLGEWSTFEVFYRYRSNDSTLFAQEFENNQAGVAFGFAF